MDSFENMSYKFAEFWTPVRQKNERMKLKVPKWDKPRSRSDSNSPFPDNHFDTQMGKFMKGSENLFQCGRQENILRTSHPRTPLQILNATVEVAKSEIEKVEPRSCISEHRTETESTLDGHLRGDRTPVSSRFYLSSANSHYVPKSTLINGPVRNKTNIRKQFNIYDENCTTPLKENNEQSSSSINLTQDFHLVDNYSDENSQQTMVLSSYQGRKEENLKSGIPTPRKTQSVGIQNKWSDRKMIFSPLKAVGLKTLPHTEKMGSHFWGTDEGSIEDTISLHDVIRSANIWDIKENFNFHCCSNGYENFFESSSPEFQLMQEPIFQMDLEPATIEIPWNEI